MSQKERSGNNASAGGRNGVLPRLVDVERPDHGAQAAGDTRRPPRAGAGTETARADGDTDKSRRVADNQGPQRRDDGVIPADPQRNDVNDAANPMCNTSDEEHPMPELAVDAAPRWSSATAQLPIPRQSGGLG